jgi:hypothetical protein
MLNVVQNDLNYQYGGSIVYLLENGLSNYLHSIIFIELDLIYVTLALGLIYTTEF